MTLMQAGALGLMGMALWMGPASAPIFTGSGSLPVSENSEPPSLRERFEPKEHALKLAWSAVLSARSTDDALTPDHRQIAGRTAILHATEALHHGPANGYAWAVLGWGFLLDDEPTAAIEALKASWHWAPRSRNLAPARLELAAQLWPRLEPAERSRTLAELRLAQQADLKGFQILLHDQPRIGSLWRLYQAGADPTDTVNLNETASSGASADAN